LTRHLRPFNARHGQAGEYGRKPRISAAQVSAIEQFEPHVVKQMRDILMAARDKTDRGELEPLKPCLNRKPPVHESTLLIKAVT
jgi:hypothetical protein